MKFIDLFSGIGGFRTGMERAGHECVAFCEWDKYALQSYKAIHNTEGEEEYHDIQKVSNEEWRRYRGTVDIICGGFPCQAFSIAGKRKGFEDTRGTNFFEIARAAQEIQPRLLFLENVKGILNHSGGWTFQRILETLDELGYIVEWGVFNSKFWGVPQNRERVFMIATRKEDFKSPILFDLLKEQGDINTRLVDILESSVDEKFYLNDEQVSRLVMNMENSKKPDDQIKILGHRKNFRRNTQVFDKDGITETLDTGQGGGRGHYTLEEPKINVLGNVSESGYKSMDVHDSDGLSPTLLSRDYKGPKLIGVGLPIKEANKKGYKLAYPGDSVNTQYLTSKTRRGRVGDQKANTVLTGTEQGVVLPDFRIRKLTPLECWRLQGFSDEQFWKAKKDGVSDSQLYKQAGNSVTVNVIEAIARGLK